jgi:L-rhamnose 1-dehydrogenase
MTLPPLLPGHALAITGGLTGIGRAIVILFLSHGASVAINYFPGHNAADEALLSSLRTEALAAIKARYPVKDTATEDEVPLLTVPGDISLPETGPKFVQETVKKFGRLDTFISNAGICKFEEFLDISAESWGRHQGTNLSGAFYGVQAAARQMVSQSPSGGSIVGVSSISALVGGAQQAHYVSIPRTDPVVLADECRRPPKQAYCP